MRFPTSKSNLYLKKVIYIYSVLFFYAIDFQK